MVLSNEGKMDIARSLRVGISSEKTVLLLLQQFRRIFILTSGHLIRQVIIDLKSWFVVNQLYTTR